MKVSEWLRQYQLTGAVPDDPAIEDNAMMAFWSGWMLGAARDSMTVTNLQEAREMAIKAAEFIESKSRT